MMVVRRQRVDAAAPGIVHPGQRQSVGRWARMRATLCVPFLVFVLAACPTALQLNSRRLLGPPPQGSDLLADPFAGRRDVASEPSVVVGGLGADCHAALFVGPRACFVRGGRTVRRVPAPDDAGLSVADPEAAFEYWLDCSELADPCGSGAKLKCVCAALQW